MTTAEFIAVLVGALLGAALWIVAYVVVSSTLSYAERRRAKAEDKEWEALHAHLDQILFPERDHKDDAA